MTDIDFVTDHYDIGKILSSDALNQGNSSSAMLVHATRGDFVLRKLRSEQQAFAEHAIYQALAPMNISPSMLRARGGLPYIMHNHEMYNLQTYIENTLPRNRINIDFVQLGRVTSLFHQLTNDLDIAQQEDRFALPQLWSAVSNEVMTSSSLHIRALVGHTEQCMEYKAKHNAIIHGDLGIWNLLFTKNNIHIIDAGEVRTGDHHFDLAAALTSAIPSSVTERELGEIVDRFERGYVQERSTFDRTSLYEQIHVWMLRGLLAVIRERGTVSETIPYVQRKFNLLEKFRMILNP